MKKILVAAMLFFSLSVHAQTDSTNALTDASQIKFIEPPDSTGFGTPDGKLISKEIGPAGGAIASEDGRVQLIFPEGALVANTNISIQPVTNMLNGSGKAYQFEPSGIQFKKQVKIIFHYTDEEAETCPPDLKSFVLQDQKGKWTFFEYDEWDSTARVLTGFIHHFSALVADQNDVLLVPHHENINVNGKLWIQILHRTRLEYYNGNAIGNEFAEFIDDSEKGLGVFVNGIFQGNSSVGTARIVTLGISKELRYTAPGYLPERNPVEIKLAFKYYSRIKKKIVWGTSKCNINVYDEYKVTVYMNYEGAIMQLIDNCSFTLKIGDRVEIEDGSIQNILLKVVQSGKCKAIYVNEATCKGIINVTGIGTANLVPAASAQGHTMVNISFQPAEASLPIFDFSPCPGAKEKSPPFLGGRAFPVRISFELKNEKQLLSLAKKNGAVVKEAPPHDIVAIIEPVRQ